jgi:hypothetical protein
LIRAGRRNKKPATPAALISRTGLALKNAERQKARTKTHTAREARNAAARRLSGGGAS